MYAKAHVLPQRSNHWDFVVASNGQYLTGPVTGGDDGDADIRPLSGVVIQHAVKERYPFLFGLENSMWCE